MEVVGEFRNTSTHFVTDEYELFYGPILQECVKLYEEKLRELHGIEISDRIPENCLALSVRRGDVDYDVIKARYPREVVETAIRYHAHAVLLAHNHPSGSAEPSMEDYQTTRRVIDALGMISVRVVDHLIFAGEDVYSMIRSSLQMDEPDERVSYVMRSRNVGGQRGTLRANQQEQLVALALDGNTCVRTEGEIHCQSDGEG